MALLAEINTFQYPVTSHLFSTSRHSPCLYVLDWTLYNSRSPFLSPHNLQVHTSPGSRVVGACRTNVKL
ncbi:uncharacterized protein TRAVEDRAFT_67161 [Trametes versicolor FP-101664 SS1]|uniref:uncharacterized protein n=1 Tax=Trametes versicolor (strain FP-101664) TaxID=717944 RepID=UPI0004623410|nr:uncharacterized protein TRAVEDRAFT_67161 [Trametes versicolor FP-101664 SS1]EIW52606.1 hypothetical protein TRAVEDRAFT_67161 [Trametes versicolor FP-101664 SS1]